MDNTNTILQRSQTTTEKTSNEQCKHQKNKSQQQQSTTQTQNYGRCENTCNKPRNSDTKQKQNNLMHHGHLITSNVQRKIHMKYLNKQQRKCQIIIKHVIVLRILKQQLTGGKNIDVMLLLMLFLRGLLRYYFLCCWGFGGYLLKYWYNCQIYIYISRSQYMEPPSTKPKRPSRQEVLHNFDLLENTIRQIYEQNYCHNQITRFAKDISFNFGFGSVYSLIRQTLQNTCKSHRMMIYHSCTYLSENASDLWKINQPLAKSTFEQCESDVFFYQTLIELVYYHFSGIVDSNRQICDLWKCLKQKFPNNPKPSDTPIRTPQLRLSTLNYLALKQLMPYPQNLTNLNLTTQFRQKLEQLNKYETIINKQHIEQLLNVYHQSQITTYQEITCQIDMVMPFKQDDQDDDDVDADDNDDDDIGSMGRDVDIDTDTDMTPDWLKKVKSNPIGKILSERLGGKFCKNQERKSIEDRAIKSLAHQLSTKNNLGFNMGALGLGLGLGLGCDLGFDLSQIQVIRTSQILKAYQQKLQQAQNAKQEIEKVWQKIETKKKRKKNKNKNKNKQSKQTTSALEHDKPTQQQKQPNTNINININMTEDKDKERQKKYDKLVQMLVGRQKQFEEDPRYGHYCQTIKLLREMKINDSERQSCVFDCKKLENWIKL